MPFTCQTGRTLLAKQLPAEVERAIREFAREFSRALDPLREDLVAAIKAGDLDPSSLSSVRTEVRSLAGSYTTDLQVVYREGAQNGAEAGRALAARRHQLDISVDTVPTSVLDEFEAWADEMGEAAMDTITEDTIRYVRAAHEEGLSIDDLADAINDDLFEGRLQDHVAERNARTSVISSSNAGSHSAYEDAGSVVGEEWLTELDGRQRQSHGVADGQVVGLDTMFVLGSGAEARYPGDPQLPVGELANCRCTHVPVFRDDLTDSEFAQLEAGGRLNAPA